MGEMGYAPIVVAAICIARSLVSRVPLPAMTDFLVLSVRRLMFRSIGLLLSVNSSARKAHRWSARTVPEMDSIRRIYRRSSVRHARAVLAYSCSAGTASLGTGRLTW